MIYKLAYLSIENGEKKLNVDKDIEKEEYDFLCECSRIIGKFNLFSDYYYMLEQSLNEILELLRKVSDRKYKLKTPLDKHFVMMDINRKFLNFTNMFNNYLTYYEVDIKEYFGEKSQEFDELKKIEKNFFDENFEYRITYNLRHYADHFKLPVSSLKDDINMDNRKFYIKKESLLNWSGLKAYLKKEIQDLNEDIDIEDLLIKMKSLIYNLHKKLATIDIHNVLASYSYLKKYTKLKQAPYIICVENIEDFKKGKFTINPLFDDIELVGHNILKMGFASYGSYKKDEGFFMFDPYDLMFTKDEKKKMGIE